MGFKSQLACLRERIEDLEEGGAVSDFLALTDTPNSYVGEAGKVPIVNPGETALEFQALPGGGDMLQATYDADSDGKVDTANGVELIPVTGYVGGTVNDVDGIATVGIVNRVYFFNHNVDGVLKYILVSGTAATASPGIIRPADYNGATNTKNLIQFG